MDGVHDLGGREGFGPILDKDDERPFHAEWEMRAYGLTVASGSSAADAGGRAGVRQDADEFRCQRQQAAALRARREGAMPA